MTEPSTEVDEENELFYFESDHLAVKGNKDYSELLKTLFILQAQQQRAIKDYEKVEKIKQQCLQDPLGTVEKLKRGEGLEIPDLQVIAEIPEINWSNYDVAVPEEGFKMLDCDVANSKENTRVDKSHHKGDKTETYNRPWSTEEQKRLEELLLIYPPEPIELRRFKKIAAALGNRTAKQVSSRLQKYFLKLHRAGLPIPGRIPKSIAKYKKSMHKHQRLNHYLWRPTTFFPELDVPVKMNETEEVPGPKQSSEAPSTSHSNYLLPGNYSENNDVRSKSDLNYQVDLLKRIKHEKERLSNTEDKSAYHYGFKCDFCSEEPITGTRWHCATCTNSSVDFCTDCLITQMYSENSHPVAHKFVVIKGNDDVAESSSDSESIPASEKNEACSSSDEISDTGVKREYNLSDLGMDENSGSLPAFNTDGDNQSDFEENSVTNYTKENNEITESVVEITEDGPYNYLCSVISNDFEDTDMIS